jgi:hypothetical protein
MDETTFQRELRELKERVSDMANIPSPTPSAAQLSGVVFANSVHHDLFAAQLRDVRTRLDIMQASMLRHEREQATETLQSQPLRNDIGGSRLSQEVLELRDSFVRCHRDTNKRISSLEQAISDLQRTTIFTPTCSETTIEDLKASQEAYPADYTESSEQKSPASVHDVLGQQVDHDRPATLSQILENSWIGHDDVPPPFMAICPPKLDHHSGPIYISEILDASATHGNPDHPPEVHLADRLDSMPANAENWQDGVPGSHPDILKERTLRDFYAAQHEKQLSAKDAEISHLNTCRTAAEEASQITRTDLEDQLLESENEIARWKREANAAQEGFEAMARCNRELQEARDHAIGSLRHDLKQCEASRHHFMTKYVDENYRFKWLEQRKLQSEQGLYQQLDECERALENSERNRDADIRDAIHSRDADVEQLYAFCQEKAALVTHQETLIAQGSYILGERDAEIDRLNVALAESQRGREYVGERAERFKRTIEKREDEIEVLRRDIKKERERRGRLEDLLRKDADVMKTKSKDADAMKTKSKDVRFDVDERQPSRPLPPFAQATEAVNNGRSMRERASWTPQPIFSNRLPQEEDRAALWQEGVRPVPEHKFGSASPIARRRRQDPKDDMANDLGARHSDKPDVRPSVQYGQGSQTVQPGSPLASSFNPDTFHATAALKGHRAHESSQRRWNHAEPQFANQQARADASNNQFSGERSPKGSHSGMEAQATANSGNSENRRHALPLDTTWLPPLPARKSASAAVEKVSSVPNLRAGNQPSRRHGAISKPASMLELRPQTYHAPSVETEAESANDQGGSSLLDS